MLRRIPAVTGVESKARALNSGGNTDNTFALSQMAQGEFLQSYFEKERSP